MRTSIFKKSDYKLCSLPAPTAPPISQFPSGAYPNNPVHQGVFYVSGGFKGSKVWCSNSVYNGNDDYENPLVYKSDDSVYPPIAFIPYGNNPIIGKIDESSDLSFNADPDISIVNGELLVLNREWWRGTSLPRDVRVKLYKGIFEGDALVAFTDMGYLYRGFGEDYTQTRLTVMGSQAMHYDATLNKYFMFDVCSSSWNDGLNCLAIRKSISTTLFEGCFSTFTKVSFYGYKIEPWHMSVFGYSDKLYAIICATLRGEVGRDSGRIYLAEFSEDYNSLYIYGRALTDFRTYRSDAFVDENGIFVLYANSYGETFNGGTSTGAYGRDVFMTSLPFSEVLKRVRR